MQRVSLLVSLFLLFASGAHADPRAMMMQGAWMQSRQPRRVANPTSTPLTIGVRPTARKRIVVPKVSALKKTPPATKTAAGEATTAAPAKPPVEPVAPVAPIPAAPKMAARVLPESGHGFFGHLMFHLGRATGAAMRKPHAWLSRLFGTARPKKEKRVIRYGSLPVGLLLTPLRNHALNVHLTPEGLVNMRRARLISDTELQLLMGQLQLGL